MRCSLKYYKIIECKIENWLVWFDGELLTTHWTRNFLFFTAVPMCFVIKLEREHFLTKRTLVFWC